MSGSFSAKNFKQSEFAPGLPLGWVVQSPLPLEQLSVDYSNKPQYIALDGSDSPIGMLDDALKKIWPCGVFTTANRVLNAAPSVNPAVAASPTYFAAAAVAGTAGVQYSTDGATWSVTSAVTPAGQACHCIIFTTGASTPRWITAGTSTGGTPACTTGDNPNSTWTACTGGGADSTLFHSLAHSPQLDLTVFCPHAAGTSLYTMPGTTTTFTTRTASSQTKKGVCWDGTYFVVITTTAGLVQRSSDGTTWTDVKTTNIPTTLSDIISDGNGTIVAAGTNATNGCVYVSKDSGNTWKRVYLPSEAYLSATASDAITANAFSMLSYANGKFFVCGTLATGYTFAWVSKDGIFWVYEPIGRRGVSGAQFQQVAWKANVYVGLTTTTSSLSATEDVSQFRRPCSVRGLTTTALPQLPLAYQEYMKVR